MCFPWKISGRKEDTPDKKAGFVPFPLPYHMVCRMILLGIVLMNINLGQRRLWTHGLGQGEVPEMLRALWRAQPRGVGSPSHGPGEGEEMQSLCIRSALAKTGVETVENTSRKATPPFIPVAVGDQASRGAGEVAPL